MRGSAPQLLNRIEAVGRDRGIWSQLKLSCTGGGAVSSAKDQVAGILGSRYEGRAGKRHEAELLRSLEKERRMRESCRVARFFIPRESGDV